MQELAEYRRQAKECRSIAAKAKGADYQAQLLDLARQWDALADEREKLLKSRGHPLINSTGWTRRLQS